MSQPFLGQISCYACNFAPRSWAFCNGQILPIQQNSPLFSILGTTYGGDGSRTFALPNLQGRAPMHWGTPQGLPPTVLGEMQGSPTVTLMQMQMPVHNHTIQAQRASSQSTQTAMPVAGISYLSNVPSGNQLYDSSAPALNAIFNPIAIGLSGQNLSHENMQPYLALNFSIAIDGTFPPRN